MPEDPKKKREEELETVVDEPAGDGLETAIATLYVGDDERTLAPRTDLGGTTTVIVPDGEPAPRSAAGRSTKRRRAIAVALGTVVLLSFLAAAAMLLVVRELRSDAAPTAEDGATPLPPSAPERPLERPLSEPPRADERPLENAEASDRPEPLRATARCSYKPGSGGYGALTIACDLTNSLPRAVRATIVPVIYRGTIPEPIHREELTLAPGQRVVRRYEARGRPEQDVGSGCACEVTTAP